jgi:hypothetical protein
MMEKSQLVRSLDVLLIGPFMLLAAKKLPGQYGAAMTFLGLMTIAYNGANFLANVNGDETRRP